MFSKSREEYYSAKEVKTIIKKVRVYIKKEKYISALKLLGNAIKNSPDHPVFILERSNCYLMMQKYQLALEEANKALELLQPEYTANAFAKIAKAQYGLGRIPASKKTILKGLQVNPKCEELVNFKRIVCREAIELTERQICDMKATFHLFDDDLNGYIEPDELKEIMKSIGADLSEEEITKIFENFDEDEDGNIDFAEFITILVDELKGSSVEKELRMAFKLFDINGDNDLSVEELKRGLITFGEENLAKNVENMTKKLRLEGKELTFEDFVRAIMCEFEDESEQQPLKIK